MAISFARPLSPFIQSVFSTAAALNSRKYNAELAYEIVLNGGQTLNIATKALVIDTLSQDGVSVSITPIPFIARVSGAPDIRHSQGSAPDSGDLQTANLDYLMTQLIATTGRPYANCFVTAYLCYPKGGGNYEGQIIFIGKVNGVEGDDEDAQVSLLSDLADKSVVLGREITQRCLNTLGDSWCGVTHLPDGAVCSNIWADKTGGCLFWGGNFQGIPFLSATIQGGAFGGTGGTGGGGGGGWEPPTCVDVDSYFPLADGTVIQGRDVKPGMVLNHIGPPVTVLTARPVYQKYRYRVITAVGASIICSATHKIITAENDAEGRRVNNWRHERDGVYTATPHGERTVAPARPRENGYIFEVAEPGYCLDLTTTAPHIYLAGAEPDFYIAHHNRKFDPFIEPIAGL